MLKIQSRYNVNIYFFYFLIKILILKGLFYYLYASTITVISVSNKKKFISYLTINNICVFIKVIQIYNNIIKI